MRVVQRTQRGVGGKAQHVVATRGERAADALWRQVGVEEETQRSGFHDLDEREQRPQLVERPPVLGDGLRHLLRVGLPVGERSRTWGAVS